METNLEKEFRYWFNELLHQQPSCLDRDVLRDKRVKDQLKIVYSEVFKEYLK